MKLLESTVTGDDVCAHVLTPQTEQAVVLLLREPTNSKCVSTVYVFLDAVRAVCTEFMSRGKTARIPTATV